MGIQLNETGTKKFAELTQNNIGEQLAVIYDGAILMVPVVKEPILEGKIQISGKYELEEVENIVFTLNASSLLASYEISEVEVLTKELWAGLIGGSTRGSRNINYSIRIILNSGFRIKCGMTEGIIMTQPPSRRRITSLFQQSHKNALTL